MFERLFLHTAEIGVYLNLPQEIQQQSRKFDSYIRRALKIPATTNHYHISLYQGRFKKSDLARIQEIVREEASKTKTFNVTLAKNLADTHEGVFWNVEKVAELENLQIRIVRRLVRLHHGLMKQYSDRYSQLNQSEQKEINQYGIPGVKNFKPHITVTYGSHKRAQAEGTLERLKPGKQEFIAGAIGIGKLGYIGNIEKVVLSSPFDQSTALRATPKRIKAFL